MEEITEGKSKAQMTSAMIQQRKLTAAFELKAKYKITKGVVCEVTRPVQGKTRIERDPLPKDCASTQSSFDDFHAGDNCLFVGLAYDHWSGKMYMEFVGAQSSLFYDYDAHGPGDESIGEVFKTIITSSHRQGPF